MSLREGVSRIVCCAVVLLTGCSSGDNGGNAPSSVSSTAQVAGTVNGGEIGGAGLSVLSAQQIATSPVQKDAYTTTVSTSGPQLLFVQDETGAIRGLTFSRRAGTGTLALPLADAASTTLALIFLSPGLVTADWAWADQTLAALPQLASYPALLAFMQANLPTRTLEFVVQDPAYQSLLSAVLDEWPAKAATLSPPGAASLSGAAFAVSPVITPVAEPPAKTTGGVVVEVAQGYTGGADLKGRLTNYQLRAVNIYKQTEDRCGVTPIVFDDPRVLVPGASKLSLFSPGTTTPVTVELPMKFPCSDSTLNYYVRGAGFAATDLSLTNIPNSDLMTSREPILTDLVNLVALPAVSFVVGGVVSVSDAVKVAAIVKKLEENSDVNSALSSVEEVIAKKGIQAGAKLQQEALYGPLTKEVLRELPTVTDLTSASALAAISKLGTLFDIANLGLYVAQIATLPPYAKVAVSAPYDTVEFLASTYSVKWSDQRADLLVTRNDGSNDAIEVQYTIIPGTALEGRDYQDLNPTPGVLKFGAKQLTASIPIRLLESRSNTTSRQATLSLKLSDVKVGLVKLGQRSVATLEILGLTLEGHYSGSFSGTDSGTIEVDIVKTGSTLSASATGFSTAFGYAFTASGTVSSAGAVQLTQGGVSTGAVFSGQLVPLGSTVLLSGTWVNKFVPLENGGFENGTFSATKIN